MRFKTRNNNKLIQKQGGFAALVVVLIISAAALILVKNTASLSLGELDLGYTYSESEESFAVVEGCLDATLGQIRKDPNYGIGGTINLTVLGGSCTIDVTDSGNDRNIIATGGKGNYKKSLEVDLTITGNSISINDWKEISN